MNNPKQELKELFMSLLEDYELSEHAVINEYSIDSDADNKDLDERINGYKSKFERLLNSI